MNLLSDLQKQTIFLSIIDDILEDIFETNQKDKENQFQNKSSNFLQHIQNNKYEIFRCLPFKNPHNQIEANLYHLKVYQQHVFNLCGYYASFNLIESIEFLKSSKQNVGLQLISAAKFWKFHISISNYLWQYKLKLHKNNNLWPWRHQDIFHGDFERTFLKICVQNNQRFLNAFKSNQNYAILYSTFEFQFGKMLMDLNEFQAKINTFIDFKENNQAIIFAVMLGITNHWASFIAIKASDGSIGFFYFDSRNRDYLEWKESDIIEFLNKEQILRNKNWSHFELLVKKQGVSDVQQTLLILCQCLIGNKQLIDFQYNNLFLEFYNQFNIKQEDLTDLSKLGKIEMVEQYGKDFYHSIKSFLQIKNVLKYLTEENLQKYQNFSQIWNYISAITKKSQNQYIEYVKNILNRNKL